MEDLNTTAVGFVNRPGLSYLVLEMWERHSGRARLVLLFIYLDFQSAIRQSVFYLLVRQLVSGFSMCGMCITIDEFGYSIAKVQQHHRIGQSCSGSVEILHLCRVSS